MSNQRVILFLICGILCCAALLSILPLHDTQRHFRSQLLEFALDAVTQITFQHETHAVTLTREQEEWHMIAPFAAPVDQSIITTYLDLLENARIRDIISFNEIRQRELALQDFGFSPAHMLVELKTPLQSCALWFGNLNATQRECYIRRNDENQLLALNAELYQTCPRDVETLRSHKIMSLAPEHITSLEIRSPGKPFMALKRDNEHHWQLMQPIAAPASGARVHQLLTTIAATPIEQYLWPTTANLIDIAEFENALSTKLELYGLDAEHATQLFIQSTHHTKPLILALGQPLSDNPTLNYLWLPALETIATVSNSLRQAIQLEVNDLRDHSPFNKSLVDLQRLQIHLQDQNFVLTQTNALWRFEIPAVGSADPAALRTLTQQLLNLQAQTLFDPPAPQAHSVAPSAGTTFVELTTPRQTWRFKIMPTPNQPDLCDLLFKDTPTIFRVAQSNLPPAFVQLNQIAVLRDKTIWSHAPATLRLIAIKQGTKDEIRLTRPDAHAAWRLDGTTAGRVDQEHLQTITSQIGTLRAGAIATLELSETTLQSHGLNTPWLELNIEVEADDAIRKSLLIGNERTFGQRYALLRGLDVIFIIDSTALKAFHSPLIEPMK